MRINEFKLIRYGKFTDRTLHLPARASTQGPDIHLIVGPNEAGKSTLRQAIGDWLFGFPTRTPMGFVHPMPELRLGGTLQRTADASALAFERTKANKNTLRTPEDAVLPDTALAPWLANLQREAYERMYGLDHDRLEPGQWFNGRIYERRCDLSPDGDLLIYFAAKWQAPFETWTAVSRTPYLTARALWPKGDAWGGGGLFETPRVIGLNHVDINAPVIPGVPKARWHPLGDEPLRLPGNFEVRRWSEHAGRGE